MGRNSGFGLAIKVVKAVNRAHNQAVRENERERKRQARLEAKAMREREAQ